MKLSANGYRLIETFEGLRLTAYPDPASGGLPYTIGIGTTVYPDGRTVQPGDTITEQEARQFLAHDVARFEAAVNRLVTVPLSQSQFDALVSFALNVGEGALESSTLLRRLNAREYDAAAAEFAKWTKASGREMPGLARRRRAESTLFAMDAPPVIAAGPSLSPQPKPANSPITTMAPVVAALLPALVGLIPELGKLFGSGSAVSERNLAAAQKVADVVVAATQAPNLQGAIESMQTSPDARNAARLAVTTQWYELVETGGGGIEGARSYNLRMTEGDGWRAISWGVVLGLLALGVVLGGGAVMASLLFGNLSESLSAQILDYMKAAGFIVLGYAFGSSASSRVKDEALARGIDR